MMAFLSTVFSFIGVFTCAYLIYCCLESIVEKYKRKKELAAEEVRSDLYWEHKRIALLKKLKGSGHEPYGDTHNCKHCGKELGVHWDSKNCKVNTKGIEFKFNLGKYHETK